MTRLGTAAVTAALFGGALTLADPLSRAGSRLATEPGAVDAGHFQEQRDPA